MAGAPKGNKNAVKGNAPKTHTYQWRVADDSYEILKAIAKKEKISMAEVIEKSLLAAYPKDFSGKF